MGFTIFGNTDADYNAAHPATTSREYWTDKAKRDYPMLSDEAIGAEIDNLMRAPTDGYRTRLYNENVNANLMSQATRGGWSVVDGGWKNADPSIGLIMNPATGYAMVQTGIAPPAPPPPLPPDTSADMATAPTPDIINQAENLTLTPEVQGLLDTMLTDTEAPAAAYEPIAAQAETLSLPPEVQAILDDTLKRRLGDIDLAGTEMLGDSVADLSRRGMLSSSVAEDSTGAIAKAILPHISQAYQDYNSNRLGLPFDQINARLGVEGARTPIRLNARNNYWNNRLNLPSSIAGNRLNLGAGLYNMSGAQTQAIQNAISNMYNMETGPLMQNYLATYGAPFGGGTSTQTQTGGGTDIMTPLLYGWAGTGFRTS